MKAKIFSLVYKALSTVAFHSFSDNFNTSSPLCFCSSHTELLRIPPQCWIFSLLDNFALVVPSIWSSFSPDTWLGQSPYFFKFLPGCNSTNEIIYWLSFPLHLILFLFLHHYHHSMYYIIIYMNICIITYLCIFFLLSTLSYSHYLE